MKVFIMWAGNKREKGGGGTEYVLEKLNLNLRFIEEI